MRMSSRVVGCLLLGVGVALPALGQNGGLLGDLRSGAVDPNDPARAAIREQNKRRTQLEKEFKKLRFEHFGDKGNPKVRSAGIEKLRTYTDPLGFQSMVEVFGTEKDDVRNALLEHLASINTREATGAIAWAAVTGKDAGFRIMAISKLNAGGESLRTVPEVVKSVVIAGLSSGNEQVMRNAADVAGVLGIFEAIPAMIVAQAGPSSGGGGAAQPQGDQAYIFIGRQQSYVADLTPVVSESAVGFDPTVGILNTGTLLRVSGAVVTTERIEIHTSLVGLSNQLSGGDTSGLGYDTGAWKNWVRDVYQPKMRELAAAQPQVK